MRTASTATIQASQPPRDVAAPSRRHPLERRMDIPRRESEIQGQSFRGQSLNLHTALMTYGLHLNVKARLTGLAAQTGRGVDQSTDVFAPVAAPRGRMLAITRAQQCVAVPRRSS